MDYLLILPELVLVAVALAVLLVDLWLRDKRPLAYLGFAGIMVAMLAVIPSLGKSEELFGRMVAVDGYSNFFRLVFLVIAALTFLYAAEYVEKTGIHAGEFYLLLLSATLGMSFMALTRDLILIYLGLELSSISTYVLAGMLRRDPRSHEASIKYFLTGALASAILLFGMSLIYGLTGSTHLGDVAAAAADGMRPLLVAAMVLLVGGFGFKIAAAPFHMWSPDTYEGAPTPVTAFLSVGPKAATLAALVRVFVEGLPYVQLEWSLVFAVLAVVSMTLGNVTALLQKNIKRMLAYSSIAHVGYILVGMAVASSGGVAAILYYVLAYTFMNVGAFVVVIQLSNAGIGEELDDYDGLSLRAPFASAALVVFFLSLIGIPFTAGFFGKFFLFSAAIVGGYTWLAVAIALNSAISVGYYFGVVRHMYLLPPREERPVRAAPGVQLALVLTMIGTLGIGLYSEYFLRWVSLASSFLP